MDTHRAMQIFHGVFLIDAEGRHPQPYTIVTEDDVASGRWRVNPEVAEEVARIVAIDDQGRASASMPATCSAILSTTPAAWPQAASTR